ncbi:MAG: hypothetical protein HOM14_01920 [Gammaproteobacteria bacterium]|jgi:hypothetical protein|nr:hypothetical protein [Gammaproteobacteria bacterium]MBT3725008.1 hypothetical protein [Gammaproteobacteria bacterium]MBT4075071.1 hypothetical protein [Gammaproteobacteria bacterium]MBT4193869.1 hypothetical protein [Gammaproteobacteria bacterium]MBT4449719.1 hypothetical protein [Gammaproteobacteria bacterium]
MNKENWVSMFREVGFDDKTMLKWHNLFEKKYPDKHQSFLEWLNIPQREIEKIRSK